MAIKTSKFFSNIAAIGEEGNFFEDTFVVEVDLKICLFEFLEQIFFVMIDGVGGVFFYELNVRREDSDAVFDILSEGGAFGVAHLVEGI